MRRLTSAAQQCQNFGNGHHVHYFGARKNANEDFLPASVSWNLGTNLLEVTCQAVTYRLHHHDPLDVARAIRAVGSGAVFFSPGLSWLKVTMGSGVIKFFSLTAEQLEACLDLV
jgi:hypothetical protein